MATNLETAKLYLQQDIPVVIGSKQFTLNTDVVPNDIPLLHSKKSMKTANMTLDFKQ